jgi:hypothetical protein
MLAPQHTEEEVNVDNVHIDLPEDEPKDIELLALYDQACQRNSGGANNPLGLGGKSGKTESDIVTVNIVDSDEAPERPRGNSRQAALRRLKKAAASRREPAGYGGGEAGDIA